MSSNSYYKEQLHRHIQQKTGYDDVVAVRSNKPFNDILNSKDRILDLADSLRETVRDEVGVFLFIKNKSNNTISAITNDFWLTSMQFSYKERVQVMEAFASSNFSFFGDNIKLYNFTAITIDATSSDPFDPGKHYYQTSILKLYDEKLRGTKLIENGEIAVLVAANHIIEGYPLNLTVAYAADTEPMTQFSFNFIAVKHYYDLDGVINNSRLENMYSTESRKLDKTSKDFIEKYNRAIKEAQNLYLIDKKIILNEYPELKKLPDKIHISNLETYLPQEVKDTKRKNIIKNIINIINEFKDKNDILNPSISLTINPIINFDYIKDTLDLYIKVFLDEIMEIYLKNSKKLYNIQEKN